MSTPPTIAVETVQPGFLRQGLDRQIIRRVDGRGQRFYYSLGDDGSPIIYPSVTSIIKATTPIAPGLLKWYTDLGMEEAKRIMNEKAAYGTFLHILCGQLLTAGVVDLDALPAVIDSYVAEQGIKFDTSWWLYESQRDLLSFAAFCNEKEVEVIAVEIPLVSENLEYAGAMDLVCTLTFNRKRVRAIVDLKSGKNGFYEDYEIQLEAYRQLWNDKYPDLNVEMVFNWAPKDWRKEPTYELKNQTESLASVKWPLLLQIYKASGETKPKALTMCKGTVILGKEVSAHYEVVEIEEHLKRKHSVDQAEQVEEAANADTF